MLVYCDESCTGHRYLSLGTTFYKRADEPVIIEKLLPHLSQFNSEVKWQKITNRAEEKYRALVDQFFDLNRAKTLNYHCLFADSYKFNHRAYAATDEDTFYKLYYNLLTYRVSPYGQRFDIHVYMDERQTKYSLDHLRKILNRGAQKVFGYDRAPYKTIEPVDSKKSKMLQTQDVILGGMATRKNALHLTQIRESKKNLSDYVLKHCRLTDYNSDTPKSRGEFSVWNFVLK